jgi:hypothetical protein
MTIVLAGNKLGFIFHANGAFLCYIYNRWVFFWGSCKVIGKLPQQVKLFFLYGLLGSNKIQMLFRQ